jgi:hypothetical protein
VSCSEGKRASKLLDGTGEFANTRKASLSRQAHW